MPRKWLSLTVFVVFALAAEVQLQYYGVRYYGVT